MGVGLRGEQVMDLGSEGRKGNSELLLKLELQSDPETLCLVRATVQCASELLHFSEDDARAIVRSVDEALANVVRHAYEGRKDLPIEIICSRLRGKGIEHAREGIEIVLQDVGVPVSPEKLKGRPLNEIRPGGLGLHFIRQSMDVVEFSRQNGKNQLRMVKFLSPAPPQAGPEGE